MDNGIYLIDYNSVMRIDATLCDSLQKCQNRTYSPLPQPPPSGGGFHSQKRTANSPSVGYCKRAASATSSRVVCSNCSGGDSGSSLKSAGPNPAQYASSLVMVMFSSRGDLIRPPAAKCVEDSVRARRPPWAKERVPIESWVGWVYVRLDDGKACSMCRLWSGAPDESWQLAGLRLIRFPWCR